MVVRLDLVETALLFKGALKESKQQQGFGWNNYKHILDLGMSQSICVLYKY